MTDFPGIDRRADALALFTTYPSTNDLGSDRSGQWLALFASLASDSGPANDYAGRIAGGADASAPVLNTAFSPASSSTITNGQAITIPFRDSDTPFSKVSQVDIWAEYGDGTTEFIGSAPTYEPSFSTSTRTGSLGTQNITFVVRRNGGWTKAGIVIKATAVDGNGNARTVSASYTCSNPVGAGGGAPDTTPPVVGNFVPTPGTPLARQDSISFDVTDASPIKVLIVGARFADGTYEIIHDGVDFAPRYAGFSSRVAISGGFHFDVRRRLGWLSGPTIIVWPVDDAGNEG